MQTVYEADRSENALAIQRFVVHSPLVAMKLAGRKNLVTLEKRTAGNILDGYGDLRPVRTRNGNGQQRVVLDMAARPGRTSRGDWQIIAARHRDGPLARARGD